VWVGQGVISKLYYLDGYLLGGHIKHAPHVDTASIHRKDVQQQAVCPSVFVCVGGGGCCLLAVGSSIRID
jgi:hypothetical protein